MAFSLTLNKPVCKPVSSVRREVTLQRSTPANRRVILVRSTQNFGEKLQDAVEGIREKLHPEGDIDTENPTAAKISRPGADSPASGTGADAYDPNTLGRREGNMKVSSEDGKHGMVTKRDAYLAGTKREELKEKYLTAQDERE